MQQNTLTGPDIRIRFCQFFQKNGHLQAPSSSLIPENDPTLLFANAGMNQFKDYFTGKETPLNPRAYSVQKCVRAGGKHNDLENVGLTARHHTFFEMLGNFSFGGYFKPQAIDMAWKFLTGELKIPPEKLFITVHHSDDEAFNIWHKQMGIPKEKIFKKGDKDNFWEMGEIGPCGPSSEIFYDHGDKYATPHFSPAEDQDLLDDEMRYVEIWNLVFMQYEKLPDGTRVDLPKPSIDTGAGLERLAAVLQAKYWNYDTDLFMPLIQKLESFSGKKYGLSAASTTSMRIVADHIRAATMLITDGVLPSNDGRGHVLRRIIRRAVRHLKELKCPVGSFAKLVPTVFDILGDQYKENKNNQSLAEKFLILEEKKFLETLDLGLAYLEKSIKNDLVDKVLPGENAFKLYDTYGLPIDLTGIILAEKKLSLDLPTFEKILRKSKEKSRKTWRGGLGVDNKIFFSSKEKYGPTAFQGYEKSQLTSKLLDIIPMGEHHGLIFKDTPFYGESGGQQGDSGNIKAQGIILAKIIDTQKPIQDFYVHIVESAENLTIGQSYELLINKPERELTKKNHSATHLLQAALIKTLGSHVKQAGSLVSSLKLRFDFTHLAPLSPEELAHVEKRVNDAIDSSLNVTTSILSKDEALKKGAQALFGEKYGTKVRVLEMGPMSIELCGGTHVSNTEEIQYFKIISEQALSTGVRRIEALTSSTAFHYLNQRSQVLKELEALLKEKDSGVLKKVHGLLADNKNKQKSLKQLTEKIELARGPDLFANPERLKDNISFKSTQVPGGSDLKKLSDLYLDKYPHGIILLYDNSKDKVSVLLKSSKKIPINCGKILKDSLALINGKGGGRPDMAQGSGEQKQFEAFLTQIKHFITQSLS